MARARTDEGTWKKLRDPGYGIRLREACDNSPHCPDENYGRGPWLQEELKKRDIIASRESIKRWLHGEVRPREAKSDALADILGVDRTWLFVGNYNTIAPRDRKQLASSASGYVNIVAGLIQIDGNSIAFPQTGDKRADQEKVDFYAIIQGANYAIHVSVGEAREGGTMFRLPSNNSELIVIGLIRDGMNFTLIDIDQDTIAEGNARGSWVEVTLDEQAVSRRRLQNFTKRF
ncbi:hypothetical protein [Sphingobium lignivorans]|uniref:Transcriptional regulator with XRE-family HTH domain n=1 Tax=Sphingobium lignivorans TaxID=2735886 RepID=A0ABR6NIK9_9SPHN|nr:hypothetical protein [Sphingobium lignivorans]MBB5986019.1 transcriptional regulator with XRE-family HTH domain [Sphingobium lignivorans]